MPRPALPVRPALRRMVALALAATLPVGCAAAEGEKTPLASRAEPLPAVIGAAPPASSGLGQYLAARHAHARHDAGAAADFFAEALLQDPDNVELLQRAFAVTAADGRVAEAGELARRVLAYDSEAAVPAVLVAVQEMRAGRPAAAEKLLAGQPLRGLNAYMMPLLAAWARVGQGDVDGALATLAPLAANSALAPVHDYHAALVNDLAGRHAAAEEFYRNTIAGSGVTLRTVQAVGSHYQRTGQPDKARELYARYVSEHPETTLLDVDGLLAAGQGLKPLTGSPAQGMAEALFGIASSVRQGNAHDIALVFGHLALHLDPDLALARVLVADVLQAQGRLEEANRIYGAIDAGDPTYYAAQLRVAGNLAEVERIDEAAALRENLAGCWPQRPDALINLGEILRARKRFAEAVGAYDRAIARLDAVEPRHWVLYYSRGIALERSKEWRRAESDFLKALELEPDQPYVLNYLGYSWVEQGVNLAEARGMIEKAVELRPHDGYIVDSLGWVLYRLGDYEAAARQLERAVELRPDDPVINDHLGDALWKVGRRTEARFQWSRALALEPEAEQVPEIRRKLADGLDGDQKAAGLR